MTISPPNQQVYANPGKPDSPSVKNKFPPRSQEFLSSIPTSRLPNVTHGRSRETFGECMSKITKLRTQVKANNKFFSFISSLSTAENVLLWGNAWRCSV
ncbi:hypothetical protein JTE90_006215 [Oedothorax gibbosus]|uniref:Uncharacterized protein n=1 Tax=Oedothorax gibbosus TaxID=931172 RepID=A0AAV6VV64_9ARAC|nr:hypothetical protein JTE90_006215 [Oedothorax gibbosus]